MPFSTKQALPALLLALGISSAQAATLGPISILSNLGEPLSAEIEIFDLADDEAGDLEVALASEMEFEKFGANRSPLMESLKLRIVQQGRRRLIQLATDKPLDQPIYSLLLELRTENETTLAEFAVLPEEAVNPSEAVASSPATTATNEVTEAASVTAESAPPMPGAASAAETPAAAASDNPEATAEVADKGAPNLAPADLSSGKQHTVRRGENLTLIARQFSVPDSALDKFITALYQENPDAFMQQNLHYLKAGAVLALPSEESLSLIDEKAARKIISTQWQTFKSLLPAKDAASGEDAGNRSSTRKLKAGGTPPAGTSGDHLTLAALKPSDTGGKTEEEAIAARKAAEEASERIRLLEKNILEMKSSVQPDKPTEPDGKESAAAESAWGILASPARDLMMQAATVLLLAALVVVSLLRRQPK